MRPATLSYVLVGLVGSTYAQQTAWGQCEILSHCNLLIGIITKSHICRRRHELDRSNDLRSRICVHILEVGLPNLQIIKFDKTDEFISSPCTLLEIQRKDIKS